MKNKIIPGLCLLALAVSASAQQEIFNVTNGIVPDGNPVGAVFKGSVNDVSGIIQDLTVTLNVSGGYNGDLYAYLVDPDGTRVTLMNQPGTSASVFGAPGSGFDNLTLDDSAADGNIQDATEAAGVAFGGTYQAVESLAAFNGDNANGTWTLFVADLSSGGGESSLVNWTMNVQATPEPSGLALLTGGGIVVLLARSFFMKRDRRYSALKLPGLSQ